MPRFYVSQQETIVYKVTAANLDEAVKIVEAGEGDPMDSYQDGISCIDQECDVCHQEFLVLGKNGPTFKKHVCQS